MEGHASRTQSLIEDWHLFGESVDAIDHILEFHGVEIQKALDPLKANDQVKISRRFAKALKTASAGEEAKALRSAIDMLDVDWTTLSVERRDRIISAARNRVKQLAVKNVIPKVEQRMRIDANKLIKSSKKSSIETHRLQIGTSFSDLDAQSAKFLVNSQANFITNEYGKRSEAFSKRVRNIVGKGVERGAGPKEIVSEIKQLDMSSIGRGDFYWEVVATSFTNRARTFGQISSYQEAGISRYVWESVLDEVTTETCRFLHNKTFPVSDAVGLVGKVEQAKTPEEVKQLQPWISRGVNAAGDPSMFYRDSGGNKREVAQIVSSAVGKPDVIGSFRSGMSEKQLLDSGLSMPPIHGLCRSSTVPDLSSSPKVTVLPTQPAPPPPPKKQRAKRPPAAQKPPPKRGKKAVKTGPNGRTLPTKKHIKSFESDMNNRDTEIVLEALDEAGVLPYLEKKPLHRITFSSNTEGKAAKFNNVLKTNHNGVYYHEYRTKAVGKPLENGLIKIKSNRKKQFAQSTIGPKNFRVWSTSSAQTSGLDQMKTTTIHEVGHHVHLSGSSAFDHLKTKDFKQVDNVVKTAYRKRKKASFNKVTQYAMENKNEYFAESYALHVRDPVSLKARDPGAFAMVEKVRELRKLGPTKPFVLNRD